VGQLRQRAEADEGVREELPDRIGQRRDLRALIIQRNTCQGQSRSKSAKHVSRPIKVKVSETRVKANQGQSQRNTCQGQSRSKAAKHVSRPIKVKVSETRVKANQGQSQRNTCQGQSRPKAAKHVSRPIKVKGSETRVKVNQGQRQRNTRQGQSRSKAAKHVSRPIKVNQATVLIIPTKFSLASHRRVALRDEGDAVDLRRAERPKRPPPLQQRRCLVAQHRSEFCGNARRAALKRRVGEDGALAVRGVGGPPLDRAESLDVNKASGGGVA
jgi:hypothetical protein